MSRIDLDAARAVREQLQRAMRACTVELEQTSIRIDEMLARIRERQETSQQTTR